MRNLKSRVTFSNIVAMLALFISLSAGVYAASKISGKQIKKGSIAGKKLKADTLTGTQINESSLGKVGDAQEADHAKSADSATTAQSADTLAGSGPGSFVASGDIRRLRFDATKAEGDPATTDQQVLELGPLRMTMTCDTDSKFELKASTTAAGAGWDIGGASFAQATDNPFTDGGGLGTASTRVLQGSFANATQRYVGTFLYNDPTTTISVPFILLAVDQSPGSTRCFLTGTATRATG